MPRAAMRIAIVDDWTYRHVKFVLQRRAAKLLKCFPLAAVILLSWSGHVGDKYEHMNVGIRVELIEKNDPTISGS